MSILWVALGAAVGAVVRHGLTRGRRPQLGLLLANASGTVVLSVIGVAGLASRDHAAYLALGTGFCGTLTTMSGLTLSAVEGRRGIAVLAAHLVLGVIAVILVSVVAVLPLVFSNAAGG